MELFLVCAVAFLASGLTLFSGFGLGTLLLPVFGIFFPLQTAIAMTAIVHWLNNLFKLGIFRNFIDRSVLLRFGLPSVIAALGGAFLLGQLGRVPVLGHYAIGSSVFQVTLLKLVIGTLMIVFALFELIPALQKKSLPPKWLPLGGLLSGFFGGLSGHQGALRSMFLLRAGLDKQFFIGTGVAIACLIDISRLSVYAASFRRGASDISWDWVGAATASAFAGAWLGNKLLKKITLGFLHYTVAIFIILFSIALMAGWV